MSEGCGSDIRAHGEPTNLAPHSPPTHTHTTSQAITSACVASLSDIIAQRLVGGNYSLQRTLKMAVRR